MTFSSERELMNKTSATSDKFQFVVKAVYISANVISLMLVFRHNSLLHRQQFRSRACSRRAVSQKNVCKHGHRFYKEMYGRRVKIVNIRNHEIFLQCAGPGY